MTRRRRKLKLPTYAYAAIVRGEIELQSIRDEPNTALMVASMWNPKAHLTLRSIKRIRIA